MADRDELGAGIGDGRESGLRNQSDILSAVEQMDIVFDLGGSGVFVEFVEFQFSDMSLQTCPGEVSAGGPDLFYDEDFQPAGRFESGRRDDFRGVILPERGGDQIQGSSIHCH